MQELWLNIPGFDTCYYVSNLGNFKSVGRMEIGPRRTCKRKDRVLTPVLDSAGYLGVGLMIDGKQVKHLAHRLVALAFIKNIDNKEQINHKNGVKTDNRVDNLEWCTRGENIKHAFALGIQCNKGEKHPSSKLTDALVIEIRSKFIPRVYPSRKLAREYGLSKTTILEIVSRKTWNHI